MSPAQRARNDRRRQYFAGQKVATNKADNLNAHITDVLDELQRNCEARGERWRAFSYGKVTRQLKNLKFGVRRVEQVEGMFGMGKKMKIKVPCLGLFVLLMCDRLRRYWRRELCSEWS